MKCTHCSLRVDPIVALDIDGTLGDYHNHFKEFLALYLGAPMSLKGWDGIGHFEEHLQISKEKYREAKLAYRQGGWKRWMPTRPGAAELVAALHRQDVEVWLVTTRPWMRLDNIDPDTREWCRRNRIEFDRMLFGEDKLFQLVKQVDRQRIVCVVDDQVDQFEAARSLKLPVIFFRHDHNTGGAKVPVVDDLWLLETDLTRMVAEWKVRHND